MYQFELSLSSRGAGVAGDGGMGSESLGTVEGTIKLVHLGLSGGPYYYYFNTVFILLLGLGVFWCFFFFCFFFCLILCLDSSRFSASIASILVEQF